MSRIYIKQSGCGTPLILLHGWGFDHQIFAPLIPSLEQQYMVYQVDLPGFGKTQAMSFEAFQAELFLHIPTPAILLGWSMGGLFATRLAIENPTRFSHLINLASSPHFVQNEAVQPIWPGITAENLNTFYKALHTDMQKTHQAFIDLQVPPNKRQDVILPETLNAQSLAQGLNVLKTWDFRVPIQSLDMPVAYLFGRLDTIVPYKTMQYMQQHYPQFTYYLFKKAGHAPFLSHSEEFLSIIYLILGHS